MTVGMPLRTFAVVTDSTADLPPAIAEKRGVIVVPLTVTIDGESYLDGILTQQQFFDRMNSSPTLPTTSQPPIGSFVEVYERALEHAEQVVSVHISSRLSGTVESARAAAAQFPGRVHVFDSLNLSGALAWQVLDAVDAADDGLSPQLAIERLETVRAQAKLLVGLDSLDNLARGGRIGKVSAFLGGLLNYKVTLTVDESGAFAPLGRSRGDKAAVAFSLDWVAQKMGTSTRGRFAVGHALTPERAEAFAEAIRERYDVRDLIIYEAGSVVATHTGTCWGITVVPEG